MINAQVDYLRLMKSKDYGSKSWSGKQSGDPLIVRGGYNCRHQWSFVNPDWYDKTGNLIIE